mgnify:CR=1 FL=1|tara:strand:+ start:150 stop:668 length:519 start_codon:yes stop_codon:yes gene_type:complete
MADNSRNRVRRWSEKKTEARQTQLAKTRKAVEPSSENIRSDDNTPAETNDLPSLESLTADSDFTPFLHTDVPSALKKAALRKLWKSDPILANVDGLNDYDEDFARMDLGKVVQTAYQVGKGMIGPKEEPEPVEDSDRAEGSEQVERVLATDENSMDDSSNVDLDGNQTKHKT